MEPHVKRLSVKRDERIHREVEAACRADPNCDYDDGTGDDDGDAFVFFDNHMEHHSTGRVTRDLSDATTAKLRSAVERFAKTFRLSGIGEPLAK